MSAKKITQNSLENENLCVVCFKNVEIYSVGDCEHPVCFECSTRMRVLCYQNECPICRRDMPKVIFTKEVDTFNRLKVKAININLLERRFGIYFMSKEIEDAYCKLLEHKCSKCENIEPFRTFLQLKEHMRRQHELFYCDLCVENLKIFSFERRCYTRTQLAMHRRKGDPDDKSHKGHPLCEFCDTRYMDSDELYRHLRRDHLYCHFCDADGKHHYYSSYEYLRQHFQTEHFLCEEGDCKNEQFTSVFRTDIDLKAHKTSVHGKQLGKIGAKQARTLELEFRLAPRPRPGDQQNQQPRQSRVLPPQTLGQHLGIDNWGSEEGAVGYDKPPQEEEPKPPVQKKPINALDPELFPSLGGAPPPPILNSIITKPLTKSSAGGSGITIRHTRNSQSLARTDENFPALASSDVPPTGSMLRFSVNSGNTNRPSSSKAPNVSIHVNHRPSIGVTARVSQISEPSPKITSSTSKIESSAEAFPVLGTCSPVQPAQWITVKPKEKPKPMKSPSTEVPVNKNFTDVRDFPSLSKTINSDTTQRLEKSEMLSVKKTSSVTVPVSNSWSSEDSSTKSTDAKTKSKKKKSKNTNITTSSVVVNTTTSRSTSTTSAKSDSKKSSSTNSKNTSGALENNNITKNDKKKNSAKISLEDSQKSEKKESATESKSQNGPGERKRSELNIGNLKTPTMNGNLVENDFPALGNQPTVKKPPGFDAWPVRTPPPGLKQPPPPGFKQPPPPGFNNVPLDVIAQSANDLTFTNSSGQKYSILPNNANNMTKNSTIFYSPPNFNQRNKKLIQNFMTALSDGDLNEFRQISHSFKQGSYSAKNYYDYCQNVLGEQFEVIFPELLALLPDIKKQKELYDIYKKAKHGNKGTALEVCATCGQIVAVSDLRHHVANHTLENHFPVLGGGTAGDISTAWKK